MPEHHVLWGPAGDWLQSSRGVHELLAKFRISSIPEGMCQLERLSICSSHLKSDWLPGSSRQQVRVLELEERDAELELGIALLQLQYSHLLPAALR